MLDIDNYFKDNDKRKKGKDRDRKPSSSSLKRILTPGVTANNIIKTAATGIIVFGTIVLMIIFAIAGSRLAGASYLPLATLAASALSIACIWMFGRPKTEEHYEEEFSKLKSELRNFNTHFDHVKTHQTEIEKRLANVELVESLGAKISQRSSENAHHAKQSATGNW